MKPSDVRARSASGVDDDSDSGSSMDDHKRHSDPYSSRDATTRYCVGMRVERDLDGLWFPATIVGVDSIDDTFELEYDEDHNRETDITADELRVLDASRNETLSQQQQSRQALTPQQRELQRKDSLLLQTTDYDPTKRPTVVLHHQGESNAASGYIINGLENNIAAGNGLRGIRWLRGNTF